MDTAEIEKSLPFILTGYSAWHLLSKSAPFDYNSIYVYVPKNQQKLFDIWLKDKPTAASKENLFIIPTGDRHLIENSKRKIAPLPQIFVDIYSLADIQSKYFIKDILDKYPLFKIEAE